MKHHLGHIGEGWEFSSDRIRPGGLALSATRFRCYTNSKAESDANQPVQTVSGGGVGAQGGNKSTIYQNTAPVATAGKSLYQNSAPVLMAGKDLTVNQITDQGAIADAFDFAKSSLASETAANTATQGAIAEQISDQNSLLKQTLSNQLDAATGGQANSNKSFLWLAGGLGLFLLLLIGILARKRKKP